MFEKEKINLGGKSLRDDSFDIVEKLDNEVQKELEGINYEILGKGETSCIVLPKPLEKTFSFSETGGQKVRAHVERFLLFGVNEEKNTEKKFVVFRIFQNELGDNYTDTKSLESFKELLEKGDEKEKGECKYKRLKDDDVLIYPPYTVHSQNEQNISGVGVSTSREYFLEEAVDLNHYKKTLEINQNTQ